MARRKMLQHPIRLHVLLDKKEADWLRERAKENQRTVSNELRMLLLDTMALIDYTHGIFKND